MFSQWDNNQTSSSGYKGKKRIILGINLCLLAYFIVSLRLFGITVIPNLNRPEVQSTHEQTKKIHRADIIDAKGNIVATTIPAHDLLVSLKNI